MKSYMSAKVATGVLMMALLSMTACAPSTPTSVNPEPSPTATASAAPTATPSSSAAPEPECLKEARVAVQVGAKSPLGIDIDAVLASNTDPRIEAAFPQAEFDTREGVRFALETHANIVNNKCLYEARNASEDWSILAGAETTGRFDAKFVEKVNADIAREKRTLVAMNVGSDGTYGTRADGSIIKPVDSVPESTWSTPELSLRFDADRNCDVLDIRGVRTMNLESADGRVDIVTLNYNVSVVPNGDGWAVADMGVGTFTVTRGKA